MEAEGPPPIRYVITGDGVRLAFWTMGQGPVLIWLNDVGFGHLSMTWEMPGSAEAYTAFAEKQQLVQVDLRNQGLSSRAVEAVSDRDFASDVLAVMDRLRLPHASLWATAGRARTALTLAALHPERVERLVLFGAWLGREEPPRYIRTLTTLFPLARTDWRLYTQLAATAIVGLEEPLLTAMAARIHQASVTSSDYRRELAARSAEDIWPLLDRVRAPTLVLHRQDEDGYSLDSAQSIVGKLRNGTLRVLPEARAGVSLFDLSEAVGPTLEFLAAEPAPGDASRPVASTSSFRTILFTDVVASTPLLAQLRDAKMREVMHEHDDVLTAAVTGHGGRVIKTIGDAFMAEFAVPSAAVEAAIAAQRGIRERFAASDVPVHIRIGINAGEPIEENGDLHGTSVVIAKRLESLADDDGILVSDVVRQAVAGKDFAFEERGPLTLKGFDEPVRAWAVRPDPGSG